MVVDTTMDGTACVTTHACAGGSSPRAPCCGLLLATLGFMTIGVLTGASSADFAGLQGAQIQAYRDVHPTGRVSQGLVVFPTDTATPAQAEKY